MFTLFLEYNIINFFAFLLAFCYQYRLIISIRFHLVCGNGKRIESNRIDSNRIETLKLLLMNKIILLKLSNKIHIDLF